MNGLFRSESLRKFLFFGNKKGKIHCEDVGDALAAMATIIWLPPNLTSKDIHTARQKLRRYKKRIGWTDLDDGVMLKLQEENEKQPLNLPLWMSFATLEPNPESGKFVERGGGFQCGGWSRPCVFVSW